MDNIKDLLGKKRKQMPSEINLIKSYVKTNFNASVSVEVQDKQIIITAPNASLAATLRMHTVELADTCKTDKRLVFRIG